MMRVLLGPDDWLGDHPLVCVAVIIIFLLLVSAA